MVNGTHVQTVPRSVRGRSESQHRNYNIVEGTQCFFRIRFLFVLCRLIQCVTASMIVFFPRTAFSHTPGTPYNLMILQDPALFTQYGFNVGIASVSLLHNLICYIIYFADKARLPFIIYTALMDFIASNGFLGLFLSSILLGGAGLGTLYPTLCVLGWLGFFITSIIEISLVCVFNHLQNNLESNFPSAAPMASNAPLQGPLVFPLKEKPPRVRRSPTVETVEDSTDAARNTNNLEPENRPDLPPIRRPDATHLSQATTIAEILQESVEALREDIA